MRGYRKVGPILLGVLCLLAREARAQGTLRDQATELFTRARPAQRRTPDLDKWPHPRPNSYALWHKALTGPL